MRTNNWKELYIERLKDYQFKVTGQPVPEIVTPEMKELVVQLKEQIRDLTEQVKALTPPPAAPAVESAKPAAASVPAP